MKNSVVEQTCVVYVLIKKLQNLHGKCVYKTIVRWVCKIRYLYCKDCFVSDAVVLLVSVLT